MTQENKPRRKFTFHFVQEVEIEIDEDFVPDEDWQQTFYGPVDLEEMARFIAFNVGTGRFRHDAVDGLAPEDKERYRIQQAHYLRSHDYFLDVLD